MSEPSPLDSTRAAINRLIAATESLAAVGLALGQGLIYVTDATADIGMPTRLVSPQQPG